MASGLDDDLRLKRGWWEVLIIARRTKVEFAHCMRHIVQCYLEAEVIRAFLDDLNTHKPRPAL